VDKSGDGMLTPPEVGDGLLGESIYGGLDRIFYQQGAVDKKVVFFEYSLSQINH
jgi:hypothetical protein